ncbi:hypothetical protein B0H13DRAFT_2308291 [Mycena leptocephala]|nr:hypothetical protein B0H13DRAFT_2308291 [Mycena leptocephala]
MPSGREERKERLPSTLLLGLERFNPDTSIVNPYLLVELHCLIVVLRVYNNVAGTTVSPLSTIYFGRFYSDVVLAKLRCKTSLIKIIFDTMYFAVFRARAYKRTGTRQFMSARLSSATEPQTRGLADDLESFLLVLLWVAISYAPGTMTAKARRRAPGLRRRESSRERATNKQ